MKKNNSTGLEGFLSSIYEGTSVLEALGLSQTELNQVSFEQLLENPDDIGDGVIKVETKFDTVFLSAFDTLFIKHHDNGDVRYLFFTTTGNASLIIRISQAIFEKFGGGMYDDSRFAPFTRKDKIIGLAKGKYKNKRDALFHTWTLKNTSISIAYKISPLRQFTLTITQKQPRILDTEVRTKGTIGQVFNLDINSVLIQNEISQTVFIEKGAVKYIDYVFRLEHPELEVFDMLSIRIFSPIRKFDLLVQSHLELTCSNPVRYAKMARIANGLIKLYGRDSLGAEELLPYEVDNLQEGHWLGRMWYLNKSHAPWSFDREGEAMAYSVTLSYDKKDDGFKLYIMSYNELVKAFV